MINHILDSDNIRQSHKNTIKGKARFKIQAICFNQNRTYNLNLLLEQIKDGRYQPSGYSVFKVYEPAIRLIHAPAYVDKIVHHMLNNVLRDHYEKKFIHDSYACIRGKGNQRAVARLFSFTKGVTDLYQDKAYLCKLDMQKFFYTINRYVLKSILRTAIKCLKTLELLFKIIDNAVDYLGLPLGNLTSQLLANILMNEADHYAKRILKCKRYLRYADDIFIFCETKEQARYIKKELTAYIENVLKLKVNQRKSSIIKLSRGFNGLGFHFTYKRISLSSQNKRRINRKISREEFNKEQFRSWKDFASIGHTTYYIKHLENKYTVTT